MADEGKLVALVVALAGSLKGVAEVVRALKERSRHSGLAHETAQELAEALQNAEMELRLRTLELADCVGARESLEIRDPSAFMDLGK